MTLDISNTDKLVEFRAEAERLGIKVEPPSINRSGVDFEVARQHDPLRAGGADAASVGKRSKAIVEAARGEAPSPTLPTSPRRINPRALNKRVLESLAAAGAFDTIEPIAPASLRPSTLSSPPRNVHTRMRRVANPSCSPARHRPSLWTCRRSSRGCRPSACSANMTRSDFSCRGHPLDDYAVALKRLRVQSWSHFSRAVKAGAGAGRVAGTVVLRAPSGAPRTAPRWGSSASPTRAAITRPCCSRRASRSIAT